MVQTTRNTHKSIRSLNLPKQHHAIWQKIWTQLPCHTVMDSLHGNSVKHAAICSSQIGFDKCQFRRRKYIFPCIQWKQNITLTLSQCTLAVPGYNGIPLKCHWLTQCTLGYLWVTQRIQQGTLEPLTLSQWSSSGNPVEIQCAWNLDPNSHWNATEEMPVVFQWLSSGLPVCSNYTN